MWKTEQGTIDISGGLQALFAVSVAAVLAEIKPHCIQAEPLSTGSVAFDALTREQQIAAVCEVGMSLLDNTEPPLEPTAYRHATLMTLLECIERKIRLEILENNTTLRRLLLTSHKELYGPVNHGITQYCVDIEQWKAFVDCIRNKMTNKSNIEISGKILDFPGELSKKYYAFCGVSKEYHLEFPDDPPYLRAAVLAKKMFDRCNECLTKYVFDLRNTIHIDLFDSP